ncbi:YkuJ family protein [Leuconostoc suionicum]|uniref:YkuJ family protein n=1 Tax=Leuconostoc suionicum TaxID=1511761 RepID=UPI00403607F8
MLDNKYNTSDLKQILNRLRAMMDSTDNSVQTRRFDAFGIETLQVSYDQLTKIWTVQEHREIRQFQFDDIDLVAIEIYDVLHDFKLIY